MLGSRLGGNFQNSPAAGCFRCLELPAWRLLVASTTANDKHSPRMERTTRRTDRNEMRHHGNCGHRVATFTELAARAVIDATAGVLSPSPPLRDARIQHCEVCGRPIAPVAQLDAFAASTGLPRNQLNICVGCRWTTETGPGAHDTADTADAGREETKRNFEPVFPGIFSRDVCDEARGDFQSPNTNFSSRCFWMFRSSRSS
jgi:hypothetical protein